MICGKVNITCSDYTSFCLSEALQLEIPPPSGSSAQAAHPTKRKLSTQNSIRKPITRRKQAAAASHRVGITITAGHRNLPSINSNGSARPRRLRSALADPRLQTAEIYQSRKRRKMILKEPLYKRGVNP